MVKGHNAFGEKYTASRKCKKCGSRQRYRSCDECVSCAQKRNSKRGETNKEIILSIMLDLNKKSVTPQEIASTLNDRGFRNRHGNQFNAINVILTIEGAGEKVRNKPNGKLTSDRCDEKPVRRIQVAMGGADYSQFEVPADIDRCGRLFV